MPRLALDDAPALALTAPTDPAVTDLADELDASVPLRAAVCGVGGTGKSVALDLLAARARRAGLTVHRSVPDQAEALDATDALLIDDVERLDADALARLQQIVEIGATSVLVTHRPGPESQAARRLIATVAALHPPVGLGALDAAGLEAALRSLPTPPTSELVAELLRLTAGAPWLVAHAAASLLDTTVPGEPLQFDVDDAARRVGADLARLDDESRELLVALAIGMAPGDPMPTALAGASLEQLLTRAHAAGVMLDDGRLPPLVQRAVLATAPTFRLRVQQLALLDSRDAARRPVADLAAAFVQTGVRDARIASELAHEADAVLETRPELASELYDDAVAAGGDEADLAARRAQAAFSAGEVDRARALLSELLPLDTPPDVERAADVAAAAWAQAGMLTRSADAYRWLEARGAAVPASAVCAYVGSGMLEQARAAFHSDLGPAPTLPAVASALLAEGLLASVDQHSEATLPLLVRASDTLTASRVLLPATETPAAVAALAALAAGDTGLARNVLHDALLGGQGGAVARPRLTLLAAWVELTSGRIAAASAALHRAADAAVPLGPRDVLLQRALEVGIARRSDDVHGLVRAWDDARDAVLRAPVDLFSLLPLAELMIAAARMRDESRIAHAADEAWALLHRLGDPPLWAAPLHWAAVQAAILAERPASIAPHARALLLAAPTNRVAAAFAAAGKEWMAVLAGHVDDAAVEHAARGLARLGMPWDGSRLAGHAAAHAGERREMMRLLALARELAPAHPTAESQAAAEVDGVIADDEPVLGRNGEAPALSAREREVVRLVLDGKSYREIGDAMFISPRTVEHHMARIRRRWEATSRSELLAHLRLELDTGPAPVTPTP